MLGDLINRAAGGHLDTASYRFLRSPTLRRAGRIHHPCLDLPAVFSWLQGKPLISSCGLTLPGPRNLGQTDTEMELNPVCIWL